jgi:hypothetical protein
MVTGMKMAVCLDVALCILALMMEAVSSSEMSFIPDYMVQHPEDSHLLSGDSLMCLECQKCADYLVMNENWMDCSSVD